MQEFSDQKFVDWVFNVLHPQFHINQEQALECVHLPGDAGFRQYLRVILQEQSKQEHSWQVQSWIGVYYPLEYLDQFQHFCTLADYLRGLNIQTPQIVARNDEAGFLLLEDFGQVHYLDALTEETANSLYSKALTSLIAMQIAEPRADLSLPLYDQAFLRRELLLFKEWFVESLLNINLSSEDALMLDAFFTELEKSALAQPQCFVHRDFHSRNLLLTNAGELGVIDFQDAVVGPITYDAVSLLRDCYIAWPQNQVKQWALDYKSQAEKADLMTGVDDQTFLQWFDFMGLQRHIKVLGIFARLSLRDGKHRYLADLPRVIAYVQGIASQYAEGQPFHSWMQEVIMPSVRQQPWWKAC